MKTLQSLHTHCRMMHKIEKLLAKNLSFDNHQLADFALEDTQQQNRVKYESFSR